MRDEAQQQCPICGSRLPVGQSICHACASRFHDDLSYVADFYGDFYLRLTRQVNLGMPSEGHGHGLAHSPMNVDPNGMEIADMVLRTGRMMLRQLSTRVSGFEGIGVMDYEKISEEFSYFALFSEKITKKLEVLAPALRKIVRIMNSYLAREETAKLIGKCPVCEREVKVPDLQITYQCECGALVDCDALRLEHAQKLNIGLNLRAQDASDLLEYKHIHVKAGTIRQWAKRGRLDVKGTDKDGHALYSVADVLDLAAHSIE